MISLYENGINGILADEMVSLRCTCMSRELAAHIWLVGVWYSGLVHVGEHQMTGKTLQTRLKILCMMLK